MFKSRPTIKEVLLSERGADPSREAAFWYGLRLENGVFKFTFRNRFEDVNNWMLPHLPKKKLNVLDVAASSGITSVELSNFLKTHDREHALLATDVSASCWFVTTPIGNVLLERSGYPLQYDLGGKKALPSAPKSRAAFTAYRGLRLLTRKLLSRSTVRSKINGSVAFDAYGCRFEPHPLMMREVVTNPFVDIATDDIVAANPPEMVGRFNLIRAANILNPDYFDSETMDKIVSQLRDRLVHHGILLVVKTERVGGKDGNNNGSLFRKTKKGWKKLDTFKNGSPIDHVFES